MTHPSPLRGLCTVAYQADDHQAAKRWYATLLGLEPYFDQPGYAEFRIGDSGDEFGLMDKKLAGVLGGQPTAGGVGGVVAYWHVDDVEQVLARLLELGATPHHPPRDLGGGFVGASVIDPFGNILGIMHNPHYLETLRA